MSSAATWGRDDISTTEAAHLPMPSAEAALDYKLTSLKEVARTLLHELESLSTSQPRSDSANVRLYDEVQRFETAMIRHALGKTAGSQTRAAKLLGVKLTTLNTKIKRYGILIHDSKENDLDHESAA